MKKDRTIKYLTKTEMSKLLKSVEAEGNLRDIAIFHVAYFLGLRVSEVQLIEFGDFDPSSQEVYVHRVKRSNSGARRLDKRRIKVLTDYLKTRGNIHHDDPLFPSRQRGGVKRSQLHWLMAKYSKRARMPVDRRHFHVLRHSIAIHLFEAQASVREAQWLLGHKSIKSTMVYSDFTTRQQSDFYDKLDRHSDLLA